MRKSGKRSHKRILAEAFVRNFEMLLPLCMVFGASCVLCALSLLVVSLSHNHCVKASICGCSSDRFENISSFMEVMIALYAISSLQSICDKFEDVRSFGNKIFHGFGEKVFNLILGRRNRRFEIDEFGVRDVYREYLKSDSKILRRCYSSARWTLLISGFSVAVALVAFLVLGMNDAVKPYIVLSAAPILMYVSAMLTYHAALYAYSAIDCYMSAKNISDEDVKNQQANDMALITNALDQ